MENPSAMPKPSATVGRRHLTWTLLNSPRQCSHISGVRPRRVKFDHPTCGATPSNEFDRSGPQRWDRKRPSRARLLFYLARWVGAAKCAVRSGGRPTTRASLVYCANRAIMASAQRRDIATVIKVGLQAFETANTALPAT